MRDEIPPEILTLEPKAAKLIRQIPTAYIGWDCDTRAWVIELEDGTRQLFSTNHGGYQRIKNPLGFLRDREKHYAGWIEQTRKAVVDLS